MQEKVFENVVCKMVLIELYAQCNSSYPSAAYMRQWTGWTLVQVMACRLFLLSIGLLGTYFNETRIGILSFIKENAF